MAGQAVNTEPQGGGHGTSGMEGLEGHMQGDAREAEGEAQPVQEADLVTQQVSCQQQGADFLWAKVGHGSDGCGLEGRALCTLRPKSGQLA